VTWSEINPVLIKVFTDVAANPQKAKQGFAAEFYEGPLGFISDTQDQALYLKVTALRPVGTPYVNHVEVNGAFVEEVVSNVIFTLQVQAHVLERTDEHWSMATLMRVRNGLYFPSVRAQFEAVNMAVHDVLPAIKATVFFGNRSHNIANMDLMISTVMTSRDPVQMGWIQRISLTSHVQLGSDDLSTPPNVADELIPSS
jgi:hypothetical protein